MTTLVRVTPFGWVQWDSATALSRVAPGGWLQTPAPANVTAALGGSATTNSAGTAAPVTSVPL
jgi:hypothetical protein